MPLGDFNIPAIEYRASRKKPIDKYVLKARLAVAPPSEGFRAQNYGGVGNPYGGGTGAFEPDTQVYEPPVYDQKVDPNTNSDDKLLGSYAAAYNAVEADKAKEAAATNPGVGGGVFGTGGEMPTSKTAMKAQFHATGSGSVADVIAAAKSMLGKPYIWGGTTSRGVDCSGLIYYAFNQAGITVPRYRAKDYGSLGAPVNQNDARAGDLVYWDEKGETDHIGLYLGNGMVIQAPQTGDVVKVSKVWAGAQYRRVLNDNAFGKLAQPDGSSVHSYQGAPADPYFLRGVSVASPVNLKDGGGRIRGY